MKEALPYVFTAVAVFAGVVAAHAVDTYVFKPHAASLPAGK